MSSNIENYHSDPEPKSNDILEELESVKAKTEKIENSHKKEIDGFMEQLEAIKKSMKKESFFSINLKTTKFTPEKKFVLKHVFEDVKKLERWHKNYSSTDEYFDAKWTVMIKNYGNVFFDVLLYCEPTARVEKWCVEAKIDFRLIKNLDTGDKIDSITQYNSLNDYDGCGLAQFLWDQALDFMNVDGSIHVEVEVEILKIEGFKRMAIRKFDESQKEVSDCILVVKDFKFYILKMYLAAQSAFFKTLFFGNFSESSQYEIRLNGIEPEDFQCFLEVLYGENAISDSTIDGILHLADMYDSFTAIRRCHEFLLEKSKKSLVQKLKLAERYNLIDLKNICVSKITTIGNIESVIRAENLPKLDGRTAQALLQKSIEFSMEPTPTPVTLCQRFKKLACEPFDLLIILFISTLLAIFLRFCI
ncbi:hypothetical protein B9Z55_006917 [Caenorhabditis nigoni]|uniref:BTB domain-containing protein n=1 Tax=Caenorhabditis nigoni TaxID=1611254 RepID=A0A2G5V787_9PELO|nr:hypothetical protein B9Z55_006917 [Caenorhabditis nigoni]